MGRVGASAPTLRATVLRVSICAQHEESERDEAWTQLWPHFLFPFFGAVSPQGRPCVCAHAPEDRKLRQASSSLGAGREGVARFVGSFCKIVAGCSRAAFSGIRTALGRFEQMKWAGQPEGEVSASRGDSSPKCVVHGHPRPQRLKPSLFWRSLAVACLATRNLPLVLHPKLQFSSRI